MTLLVLLVAGCVGPPPPPPTVPGSPTAVTATAKPDTLGSVELSWTPPASNGGAPIDHYQVSVTTDDGANWTTLDSPTAPPTVESCGMAGTTCRYTVSAHNTAGYGLTAQSNDVFMSLSSPFMVCGYDPHDADGLAAGYSYNLLTYDPSKPASQQYAVDPAATGKFYYIQGSDVPGCGAGSSTFDGHGDPGTLIDALPFWIRPSTGTGNVEFINNAVPGMQVCDPDATQFDGCGMLIPITIDWNQQAGSAAQFKTVLFTIWQVWGGLAYDFNDVPVNNPTLGKSCENPVRLLWLNNANSMKYCGLLLGTSSMIAS